MHFKSKQPTPSKLSFPSLASRAFTHSWRGILGGFSTSLSSEPTQSSISSWPPFNLGKGGGGLLDRAKVRWVRTLLEHGDVFLSQELSDSQSIVNWYVVMKKPRIALPQLSSFTNKANTAGYFGGRNGLLSGPHWKGQLIFYYGYEIYRYMSIMSCVHAPSTAWTVRPPLICQHSTVVKKRLNAQTANMR